MKPELTNIQKRVNTLYRYMKCHCEPITKATVCEVCGVGNERQAREIISLLAQHKPIISTSDNKGYRLAMTGADVEDARHTWAELSSRMEELEKRIKPLIEFLESEK